MSDKPEFEALVEAHGGEIYRYLWRMLGDPGDAQDCLQDAYLRAYKAYGRLDADANTRAWLYKIAGNCAKTQLKQRGKHNYRNGQLLEHYLDGGAKVEQQAQDRALLVEVHALVMELPHKQRAALLLRKYQQLEYAEIAEALNCSQDSARANVYQALNKLRKELGRKV